MGLLAAVLSNLAFAVSDSLWTLGLKRLSPLQVIFQRTLFSLGIIGLVVLISGSIVMFELKAILICLGIAACSYGGLYFFVKSMAVEDNRKIVIVVSCLALFSSLSSFLILNEAWNSNMLYSLLLFLLSAIILYPVQEGLLSLNKGLIYALLAAIIWGITLPLLSIPAKMMGGVNTSFFTELSVLMCTMAFNFKGFKETLSKQIEPTSIWLGVAAASAVLAMNYAYEHTLAAYIGLIGSTGNLISQVLISLIYKKPLKLKYLLSGLIAAIAMVLLVLN